MSDESDNAREPEGAEEKDDEAIRALLKRASEPGPERAPSLLRGVQKRIRARSRGKFYADGWSTTQSRINYALVAVAMLLVIAVAYFVLGPTGISAR